MSTLNFETEINYCDNEKNILASLVVPWSTKGFVIMLWDLEVICDLVW